MPKVTNVSTRARGFAGDPGFVLEVGESRIVSAEHCDQLKGMERKGLITIEGDEVPPEPIKDTGVHIEGRPGGWYRVMVAGIDVAGKNMRKADAIKLALEYQ